MKKTMLVLLLFICLTQAMAQERTLPQLKKELNQHLQRNTLRVTRLLNLPSYSFQSLGERTKFGEEALD